MPITARNICVTGSQGRVILDNVHVSVPDGSVTLIVGRNGAGKSTLLDALSGLVNLQSGEVHYDGIPLWNGKRLNKEAMYLIGNVFQYPEQQLFAQTVEGEFAFSLKYLRLPAEEIAARSLLALRQAALPEDWLTVSPHQLSGGQKRRVALATTMSTDPRWLLLDEPTAGLDAEGTNTLLSWLHRCKQEGRGMVIVTHDLETLLPLADQVIVLQSGRVFAQIAGEDIGRSGNILREAGLGVPFTLQMAELLTTRGEELAAGYPDAARLAEAVERLTLIKGRNQVDPHPRSKTESDQSNFMPEKGPANEFEPEVAAAMEASGGLAAIDPRAKWLFCMLLSLGILLQNNWLGLLISALMAAAVVGSVRGAWRILLRLSLPFTFFIVISMIVSGAEFAGGVHFAAASSMRTLFELIKVLIALGVGVGFAASTSQLMMKHALEQSLGWLRKIRFPVDAFALATSLIMRFIPVLMREYRRFARIVRARGKQPARSGSVRLRELPVMFIPLLIALFQLASDLTTAMQARGLTSFRQQRTSSFLLKMKGKDWFVVLIGALGFALLLWLTWLDQG